MEVRSFEAIVRALDAARVDYLVVGGLAVIAHGYERLTKDVDLVIGLERDNILRGLRALMSIGYQLAIPVTPEEFANSRATRGVETGQEQPGGHRILPTWPRWRRSRG